MFTNVFELSYESLFVPLTFMEQKRMMPPHICVGVNVTCKESKSREFIRNNTIKSANLFELL